MSSNPNPVRPIPSWALRAGVRHRDHRTRWPVANAAVVQPTVGTRSPGAFEAMGAPTLGMLHVHVCVVCVLSEEISYIRDTINLASSPGGCSADVVVACVSP